MQNIDKSSQTLNNDSSENELFEVVLCLMSIFQTISHVKYFIKIYALTRDYCWMEVKIASPNFTCMGFVRVGCVAPSVELLVKLK